MARLRGEKQIIRMQRTHRNMGGHFFDIGVRRLFQTIVHPEMYKNAVGDSFFVTSEQYRHGWEGRLGPRRFTVRRMSAETGCISKVSSFQEFSTLGEALKEALRRAVEDFI